jgi:hypothetical protein
MGHSASIAKKYNPQQKDDEVGSEHDSLATVSSFRATSPLAHSDAREFTFEPQSTAPRDKISMPNHHSYHGQMNGTVPRRTLASQRNITASSSTLGTKPRSMREVKHFLVKNPELLAGKHGKSMQKNNQFDVLNTQKQIKTKQDVYLGLFDPPTIYGRGVDRGKQLKMNQRLYLQLIYPTVTGMKYNTPSVSLNRPVGANEMVVIRREDERKQEDYTKKPPRARSRPPLKSMEVARATPVIKGIEQQPYIRSQSQQQVFPEPTQHRSQSPSKSPRIPNGYALPSSTPIRGIHVPKPKRGNDYTEVSLTKPSSSVNGKRSQRGFPKIRPDTMEVERKFGTPNSQRRDNYKPNQEEEVVFTYDVEELGLKKKSEGAYPKDSRDKVVPLYFRKSLAYNPKYSNGGNILSDPL